MVRCSIPRVLLIILFDKRRRTSRTQVPPLNRPDFDDAVARMYDGMDFASSPPAPAGLGRLLPTAARAVLRRWRSRSSVDLALRALAEAAVEPHAPLGAHGLSPLPRLSLWLLATPPPGLALQLGGEGGRGGRQLTPLPPRRLL